MKRLRHIAYHLLVIISTLCCVAVLTLWILSLEVSNTYSWRQYRGFIDTVSQRPGGPVHHTPIDLTRRLEITAVRGKLEIDWIGQFPRKNIPLQQREEMERGWKFDVHGVYTDPLKANRAFTLSINTRVMSGGNHAQRELEIGLPIWLAALITAILPAMYLHLTFRRRRSTVINPCPSCGYSLFGNISGVCPECGSKVNVDHAIAGSRTPPGSLV